MWDPDKGRGDPWFGPPAPRNQAEAWKEHRRLLPRTAARYENYLFGPCPDISARMLDEARCYALRVLARGRPEEEIDDSYHLLWAIDLLSASPSELEYWRRLCLAHEADRRARIAASGRSQEDCWGAAGLHVIAGIDRRRGSDIGSPPRK